MRARFLLVLAPIVVACGSSSSSGANAPGGGGGPPVAIGDKHDGDYSLGPVAFQGSFANSCAPYTTSDEAAYGPYLAGTGLDFNGAGQLCDACIRVTTRMGKSVVARVVTTGTTKSPGDLDLSPAAYDAIHQDDPQGTPDHPRPMSWQIVSCDTAGGVAYQFRLARTNGGRASGSATSASR